MAPDAPVRTVAVVVGIEEYLHSNKDLGTGIRGVEFAAADAVAMRDMLKTRFEIQDGEIHLWINQEATKTRLDNELKYFAESLGPDDRFIFYYAGHGFYANGTNRLTAWDTHPTNLYGTTVCIREVLLDPLARSRCSQALLFIDACAAPLADSLSSRDLLADMQESEFEEFVRSRDYQAIFMSCSPGEKSFPNKTLKHGIWTFHLLRALSGEEPAALQRNEWLTDTSLRDYLRSAVVTYLREKTSIQAQQRPFAMLNAPHTFQILRFEENLDSNSAPKMPRLSLKLDDVLLRHRESRLFRELPGFDKKLGHTVPLRHSGAAAAWASKLLAEEIADESKQVYDNAKKVFSLKRAEIKRTSGGGSDNVDTEFFRITWDTGQDPVDASRAFVDRILRVRVFKLPEEFDSVFPVAPRELVIPFDGIADFDNIANSFESLATGLGAKFEEDEDRGRASLILPDGTTITVLTSDRELVLTMSPREGVLALLGRSVATLASLGQRKASRFLSGK